MGPSTCPTWYTPARGVRNRQRDLPNGRKDVPASNLGCIRPGRLDKLPRVHASPLVACFCKSVICPRWNSRGDGAGVVISTPPPYLGSRGLFDRALLARVTLGITHSTTTAHLQCRYRSRLFPFVWWKLQYTYKICTHPGRRHGRTYTPDPSRRHRFATV